MADTGARRIQVEAEGSLVEGMEEVEAGAEEGMGEVVVVVEGVDVEI